MRCESSRESRPPSSAGTSHTPACASSRAWRSRAPRRSGSSSPARSTCGRSSGESPRRERALRAKSASPRRRQARGRRQVEDDKPARTEWLTQNTVRVTFELSAETWGLLERALEGARRCADTKRGDDDRRGDRHDRRRHDGRRDDRRRHHQRRRRSGRRRSRRIVGAAPGPRCQRSSLLGRRL